MFRHYSSQALAALAFSSSLIIALPSLSRVARAAPNDVVDLEANTQHNPPASTTDTTSKPPTATTDSENRGAPGIKERNDAAKDAAAAKKLNLRAGERVGAEAQGKAQVLGMALQEGSRNRVKVVDVAMNSPAFDAGVMKGDEIVAFQGFRGESYRKWIDGIRRLTTDTAAGLKIPVVVTRDGKQLTVQIEVQEKAVRPSNPRAFGQNGSQLIPPGVGPALPGSSGPTGAPVAVGGGGNNVVVGGGGPFGEFFGGPAASANERAVAQIVRIGGQPTPNPSGTAAGPSAAGTNQATPETSTVGATAAPKNGGARIGMAGFRDDPTGMLVMVDVGALPPGNYKWELAIPA